MLREKQLTEFPRPVGRRRIALMSCQNGPLHEDVPFPCERINIANPDLSRECFDIASDIRQVRYSCLMDWMARVVNLDQSGDE